MFPIVPGFGGQKTPDYSLYLSAVGFEMLFFLLSISDEEWNGFYPRVNSIGKAQLDNINDWAVVHERDSKANGKTTLNHNAFAKDNEIP